jgi:predicted nucleic acid-binding protein
VQQLIDEGLLLIHALTEVELEQAKQIAEDIAFSPMSKDMSPESHIPDAEAIVLMERQDLGAVVILLDELAAREVARRRGYAITGFPGILYYAVQHTHITPEEARALLYACQNEGTYYSTQFIESLYQKMREVTSYNV